MSKNTTDTIKNRYNRISSVFDIMDKMMPEKWREELLDEAKGNILEIGVGTGSNLAYYPTDAKVTGIDFSPAMLAKAKEKLKKLNTNFELVEMDTQSLDFPDNTFDTVISTCVFCSVPDPVKGLKEIRRVLKPNGHLLMLEHMRSDNEVIGKVMDFINPIGLHISGANINRRTIKNIENVGLRVIEEEMLMSTIMRKLKISPNK